MIARLRLTGHLALLAFLIFGLAASGQGQDAESDEDLDFDVLYEVRVLPTKQAAQVTIVVSQPEPLLTALLFEADPERHAGFAGDGTLRVQDGLSVWEVPPQGGRMTYTAQIDHLREPAEYDARCTADWALFRGTDVVPPVRARHREGARASARLRLRVPPGWEVMTPFEPLGNYTWRVMQKHRVLDAPRGWLIMGKLKTVRTMVNDSEIVIASPAGQEVRARDALAFLRWTLPELARVTGKLPPRLLIVSADDPMWRGGLSGPASLYLHADRPLIDRDGSSPVLHELVHVAMRGVSGDGGDWIVEGLAEYYSLEILVRTGALTEEEHAETLRKMRKRGREAKTLLVDHSTGAVTRRAVGVMADLDAEIRKRTDGQASLDGVLQRLVRRRRVVSYDRFRKIVAAVARDPLDDFFASRVD